jgi:hypothetical protein
MKYICNTNTSAVYCRCMVNNKKLTRLGTVKRVLKIWLKLFLSSGERYEIIGRR